ncbi:MULTISPECIES: hypothetical protein [unclassified Colwellia]|uniref:hypothetical protein n=1 Tax=unclassified Colwellia TaxID=196834 RepID=UPI0015F4BEE2|nr:MULTISPECIES: hypothetical protein [unclassified Colwellia]MBA6255007.1 hypothetical protein [Colwellia sp. MB3u-28]MBA6259042.1 hypothetical protein [Colwellia sp. MB3u-41]
MEIAIWTFILVIIFTVLKAVKYEKNYYIHNEKQLLERYFEIKNINPDYRINYLRDWESNALKAIEESTKSKINKVIHLKSIDNIK